MYFSGQSIHFIWYTPFFFCICLFVGGVLSCSVSCFLFEMLIYLLYLESFVIFLVSFPLYTVTQEERSIFWEVAILVILNKKVYTYMYPIPNGFRNRAISLYSSKIVNKKEILHTVSNTGIYCSSDKVGTVYLV
jgi:hypothetical protein